MTNVIDFRTRKNIPDGIFRGVNMSAVCEVARNVMLTQGPFETKEGFVARIVRQYKEAGGE